MLLFLILCLFHHFYSILFASIFYFHILFQNFYWISFASISNFLFYFIIFTNIVLFYFLFCVSIFSDSRWRSDCAMPVGFMPPERIRWQFCACSVYICFFSTQFLHNTLATQQLHPLRTQRLLPRHPKAALGIPPPNSIRRCLSESRKVQ